MTTEKLANMSDEELQAEIQKGCLTLTDIIDRNYIEVGEYIKEDINETWYGSMCKLFTKEGVICRGSFGSTDYPTVAFIYECMPYIIDEGNNWVESRKFDVSRWRDIAKVKDGKRFALFANCNYFDHSAKGWDIKFGATIFLGVCEINKRETLKRGHIIWKKVEEKLYIDKIRDFSYRNLPDENFEESDVYKRALDGDANSQNIVGESYLYGIGDIHDFHRATSWLKEAARQRHADAAYTLGALFYEKCRREFKDKDDIQKAADYLQIAAESEHASAIRVLGDMHRLGYGYEEDEYKALRFYEKSAALGDDEAAEKIDAWKFGIEYRHLFVERAEKGDPYDQFVLAEKYFITTDQYFRTDKEKAFYWYKKAAEQGHSDSQRMLGICYTKGIGVERDYEKGMDWLVKAADNGNDRAMVYIAHTILGTGSSEKDTKAVKYLLKAEKRANNDAIFSLAICHLKGYGVEKDIERAIEFLKKLDEKEDPNGAFKLAELYEQGEYVEKNITKALDWYKRAAELGCDYYIQHEED